MIAPGTKVGKYEVRRLLGQGGFGMVFAARDTTLDRECAMKFLLPEHTARPEILQRFLKEARSAAKIRHPGIVTVFEADVVEGVGAGVDGTAYIAMELLEGESLSDRVRRGPLPIEHATEVGRQVASALAAAHAVGIIHRDLKPDNIFLTPDPATTLGERVKVLDFGIAKLADPSETTGAKTSTHMIFGTPKYMSPEQCKSTAKVDERSDIYALGCILFEMVTGRAPFEGDAGELIAMQQLTAPPQARTLRTDLPPRLDSAISAMLAKQPTLRPSTMTDVVRSLGATSSASAATPAAVHNAEVAPTLAPDAVTAPPGPVFPTSPPAGIERVPPTVAIGVDHAPVAASEGARRPRSMRPLIGIGGLVIVGGTVAIIAAGGGGGGNPNTTGSGSAQRGSESVARPVASDAPAAELELTATRYYEISTEAFTKGILLMRADKCAELRRLADDVRLLSPLVADRLADLRCGTGEHTFKRPSPDKVYAMPQIGPGPGITSPEVTMIVGSDYDCAHCERVRDTLDRLVAKYVGHLRIVFRPLVVHPATMPSAVAACAAAEQQAFAAFDKALWEQSFKPHHFDLMEGTTPCYRTTDHCPVLLALATQLKLDLPRFKRDMETCVEKVSGSVRDWHRLHVSGAPSFLVNGRYLAGAYPFEAFEKLIDEELETARTRIAKGTPLEDYYERWVIERGKSALDPDDVERLPAIQVVAEAQPVTKPPADAQRTAKGVYFKILRRGMGEKPGPSSKVRVNYTGWTMDGKEFDSTTRHGGWIEFKLTSVIPGWTDGLQQLSEGDLARLWVPEELAYRGKSGAPAGMLVFDIELLAVLP